MNDPDAQLLKELARRNWIIFVILCLVSLAFRSREITLGVVCGGLVAILGYRWLHRSLSQALADPSQRAAKRFQFQYLFRLAALAAALFLLIAVAKVNPIGLAVGISVVVINLIYTTIKRLNSTRRR